MLLCMGHWCPLYLCPPNLRIAGFFEQYAHRKCVQRWCNEKGDTTCEICHKVFFLHVIFIYVVTLYGFVYR